MCCGASCLRCRRRPARTACAGSLRARLSRSPRCMLCAAGGGRQPLWALWQRSAQTASTWEMAAACILWLQERSQLPSCSRIIYRQLAARQATTQPHRLIVPLQAPSPQAHSPPGSQHALHARQGQREGQRLVEWRAALLGRQRALGDEGALEPVWREPLPLVHCGGGSRGRQQQVC